MRAFRNVRKVTMVNIPALTTSYVRMGFVDVKELEMENASLLENHEKLGELKRKQDEERKKMGVERRRKEEEERKRREQELKGWIEGRKKATVLNARDLENLSVHVKSFNVEKCEDYKKEVLDLSRFTELLELKIGDDCFSCVNEVNMIGLSELESIVIGENSFTQQKNSGGNDPNGHFYLKNCPKLKSLKMGRYSFSDYSVCEIENVDALEVIEMGELNGWSSNFKYASLELKSILIHNE